MNEPRYQLVPGARLRSGPGVGWRLLGSNNRELGRCAVTYPDADAALASVRALQIAIGAARARVIAEDGRAWGWRVALPAGGDQARSARLFQHERDCRRSLELFLREAERAGLP